MTHVGNTVRDSNNYWVVAEYARAFMVLCGAAMFIATWHWVKGRDAS